ncbi:MAG: M20/M25/M40 family metallo-hydrolase [Candidatus Thermoplasmatota archaeon]|nr:M20/M25/M40 family metallo-hydrolase [Candidatus Thermoplasmatota archaeon]
MRNAIDDSRIFEVASSVKDDEVLRLSQDLIRIPSIYGQEKELAEHIAGTLEGWGLRMKTVPVKGYGPCVVCAVGKGAKRSIVLNGHMDTVEVKEGWSHDPFGAKVQGGFLYGLGALDMKSGLAALMIAFRTIADSGLPLRSGVTFQAVSGEEDNGIGTRTLISRGFLKGAKAAIVGEGFGGLRVITNARRGASYYDIDLLGRSAHGATPELGVNAVADAARVVVALDNMKMKTAPNLLSEELKPLRETQTVLNISGGSFSLSVPDRCSVNLVRFTLPNRRTDAREELASVIRALRLGSSTVISLKEDPGDLYHPYLTSPASDLVRTASKWVGKHAGASPKLVCGVSEADDNKIAELGNVPVICLGPGERGRLAKYHQPDEAISTRQLGLAARIYCSTVLELARTP